MIFTTNRPQWLSTPEQNHAAWVITRPVVLYNGEKLLPCFQDLEFGFLVFVEWEPKPVLSANGVPQFPMFT